MYLAYRCWTCSKRSHLISGTVGTLRAKVLLLDAFQEFRFRLDTLEPMIDSILATVPKEADVGKLELSLALRLKVYIHDKVI